MPLEDFIDADLRIENEEHSQFSAYLSFGYIRMVTFPHLVVTDDKLVSFFFKPFISH